MVPRRTIGLAAHMLSLAACSGARPERERPEPPPRPSVVVHELAVPSPAAVEAPRRDADGLGFHLRGGDIRASVREARLGLSLDRAEANEVSLTADRIAGERPQVGRIATNASELSIELGRATELVAARPDGVEQSFRFDAPPPGGGDLRIHLVVDGAVVTRTDASGVHLRARDGSALRYGHGTWIDRRGHRARVEATGRDHEIELRVPADLVASSQWPAVLDPIVSSELAIDESVLGDATSPFDVRIVRTDAGFFTVWSESVASRWRLYGMRLRADGTLIDAAPTVIATTASVDEFAVASSGPEVFVVWKGVVAGSTHPMWGRRIRASDGALLDSTDTTLAYDVGSATRPRLVWAGDRYFLAWLSGTELRGTRIRAGAAQDLGGAPRVYATGVTTTSLPVVIGGSDGVLLAWNGAKYLRVAMADGNPLDAAPRVWTTLRAATGGVSGAFDGTNYVLVWDRNNDVFGARVRASDGASLDADDDFNLIPGSKAISTDSQRQYHPRVACDGTRLLVAWYTEFNSYSIEGVYLDSTTLVRTDSTGSTGGGGHVGGASLRVQDSWDIGVGPTSGAVVFQVGKADSGGTWSVVGAKAGRVRDSAGYAEADGAAQPLRRANWEAHPGVATNGSDYLLAWWDRRTSDDLWSLYVIRARGSDHTLIDAAPVAVAGPISDPSPPSVASDGTNYLVAWSQGSAVRAARIDAATGAIMGTIMTLDGAGAGYAPSVAFARRHYMVGWEASGTNYQYVRARRIHPVTGALPDAATLSLYSNYTGSAYSTRFYGLVLAADAPADDARGTFVFAWSQNKTISGVRVRDALGAVVDTSPRGIATTTTMAPPVVLASDGHYVLASWSDGGWTGTRLDPLDFSLLDVTWGKAKSIGGVAPSAVGFDGTNYLGVRGYNAITTGYVSVTAARATPALSLLDTTQIPIFSADVATGDVAVASRPDGETAVAYARFVPEDGASAGRLRVRFVTEDLAGPDAGADAGADGDGGVATDATVDASEVADGADSADVADVADATVETSDAADAADATVDAVDGLDSGVDVGDDADGNVDVGATADTSVDDAWVPDAILDASHAAEASVDAGDTSDADASPADVKEAGDDAGEAEASTDARPDAEANDAVETDADADLEDSVSRPDAPEGVAPVASSGCGCEIPGAVQPGPAPLLAVSALGWVAALRRRRRRAR